MMPSTQELRDTGVICAGRGATSHDEGGRIMKLQRGETREGET